ncbi:hypothetical protein KAU11_10215, partial [Candidatus Babeliales bacterium]|nr:hypothetical protein [Candidatus Babeliales bacterium]
KRDAKLLVDDHIEDMLEENPIGPVASSLMQGAAEGVASFMSFKGATEIEKEERKIARAEKRAARKAKKATKANPKMYTDLDKAKSDVLELKRETGQRLDIVEISTGQYAIVHPSQYRMIKRVPVENIDPLVIPIITGIVSGVTGVTAGEMIREHINEEKRKKRQAEREEKKVTKKKPKENPHIARENFQRFQKKEPTANDDGKIADGIKPIKIIGPIEHVVYHTSKWDQDSLDNQDVNYIHTWKKNHMHLCRDKKGVYLISGLCEVEGRGIDDYERKPTTWGSKRVDYLPTEKDIAFLGLLKEIKVKDGETYKFNNMLLCSRGKRLYMVDVSPETYEEIRERHSLS